jgi:hypothetical protein
MVLHERSNKCHPHKSQNPIQKLHFQSIRNEYKIMVDQLGAHMSKGSSPLTHKNMVKTINKRG